MKTNKTNHKIAARLFAGFIAVLMIASPIISYAADGAAEAVEEEA